MFEDTEWGNAEHFSYYETPGSKAILVSSTLLETSLQKEKRNLKKRGEKLQRNEKRKLVKEKGGQSESPKKNKRQKPLKQDDKLYDMQNLQNKTTMSLSGCGLGIPGNTEVGEEQEENVSLIGDGSAKMKKKKKKKESNKMEVAQQQQRAMISQPSLVIRKDITDSASFGSSKKKKKKTTNKRNKYKELNIKQNLRKNNLVINGSTAVSLQSGRRSMSPVGFQTSVKMSDKSIIKDAEDAGQSPNKNGENVTRSLQKKSDHVSQIFKSNVNTLNKRSVKKKSEKNTHTSDKSNRPLVSDVPREEVVGDLKNSIKKSLKKKKAKKNTAVQSKDGEEVSKARPSTLNTMAKLDAVGKYSKVKGKKKGLTINGGLEIQTLTENNMIKREMAGNVKNKMLISKVVDTNDRSVKKSKGKKEESSKSNRREVLDSNKCKSGDSDDEELDLELIQDLDAYMKKLPFEKCKNGSAANVALSSDEEERSEDSASDDSEDVYVDGESLPYKDTSSKNSAVKKTVAKRNIKETSSKMSAESKDMEKYQSPTNINKEKTFGNKMLKMMLLSGEQKDRDSNANSKVPKSPLSEADVLREKMKNQINAARFRIVNEQMYTTTSSAAVKMFKQDRASFHLYHAGFQSKVAHWPMNPLDVIIKWLANKPKSWVVADFGCGEARLAISVPQESVHSFDLVAVNSRVRVCDMSHSPLPSNSVDVVVFCLSLMGTNINDFIVEANRVLREGGIMRIAEVESRFKDTNIFVKNIKQLGFHCVFSDTSTEYFYMFEFKKHRSLRNKKDLPNIVLKPCMYKKR